MRWNLSPHSWYLLFHTEMLWLSLLLTAVEGGTWWVNIFLVIISILLLKIVFTLENELNKGTSFKDIARFLCKDPTTISKEIKAHRLSDWYHKGTFYNANNFCIHRYHCRKTNVCGMIILCGVKCASCPTCNQTCKDFEKNVAADWTKLLMSAMAAQRRSIIVRLPINTITMPGLRTESIGKSFGIPESESTWPNGSCVKRIRSFLLWSNKGSPLIISWLTIRN